MARLGMDAAAAPPPAPPPAGREAELLARIALLEAQLRGQAEQPMHG